MDGALRGADCTIHILNYTLLADAKHHDDSHVCDNVPQQVIIASIKTSKAESRIHREHNAMQLKCEQVIGLYCISCYSSEYIERCIVCTIHASQAKARELTDAADRSLPDHILASPNNMMPGQCS